MIEHARLSTYQQNRPAVNPRLQDTLLGVLVRRSDNLLTAGEQVDWATSALTEGLETPAVVILAGLSRTLPLADTDPWFQKALSELGISVPPPDELRRGYLGAISRAVLGGSLLYREALNLAHRHVVSPLNHPRDLMPWCFVWENLAPIDFQDLNGDQAEQETRILAKQWADRPAFASPA